MKDQLSSWLSHEIGAPVSIEGLERTTAGFSRENWTFEAAWNDEKRSLIARRDPVGSVLDTERAVEMAVLRALEHTDVGTPRLLWADLEGRRCDRPCLVMERVDGVCDSFALRNDRPIDERAELARRIYDRLARIHLVDWRALGLADVMHDPGSGAAVAALAHWTSQLRRVQVAPEPELAYAISWLGEHAPANDIVTLVHGDFKPGNVLIQEGDVSAVLDWETAHLGDPHEDLGWVSNPLRAAEHQIPTAWEPTDLFDRWSSITGFEVDLDRVRWWQILANVKLAIIVLTGIHAYTDGRLDRVHQSPVVIYRLLLDQMEA
jgi:aminoglycoside phosphotransferase (APT) family kinase protein